MNKKASTSNFSKNIPKYNKLLILDIDETLIHSSEKQLDRIPDFRLDKYFVYIRPGLKEFISNCSKLFNLAIWTASSSEYAIEVIKNIFPDDLRLEFIFTGERCLLKRNLDLDVIEIFKPLKKVKRKGYLLNNILIVDDTAKTFKYNYGNGILIKEYLGESNDNELSLLLKYLEIIGAEENVRVIDKRRWKSKI